MTGQDQRPPPNASVRLRDRMREQFTFQISVDTDNLPQGPHRRRRGAGGRHHARGNGHAAAQVEGVLNVVPAFRRRFPEALLLADMKTMDGGGGEARAVFEGGGNIIDFSPSPGSTVRGGSARCATNFAAPTRRCPGWCSPTSCCRSRARPDQRSRPRSAMLDAGVDGVGIHLQLDARRATPQLCQSGYLADVAQAVFERVGDAASVQVVGGLSVEQALGARPSRAPRPSSSAATWDCPTRRAGSAFRPRRSSGTSATSSGRCRGHSPDRARQRVTLLPECHGAARHSALRVGGSISAGWITLPHDRRQHSSRTAPRNGRQCPGAGGRGVLHGHRAIGCAGNAGTHGPARGG